MRRTIRLTTLSPGKPLWHEPWVTRMRLPILSPSFGYPVYDGVHGELMAGASLDPSSSYGCL